MKKILIVAVYCLLNAQTISAQWTVDSLAQNRYGMISAVVGSKAVFTNGSAYDIYNFATAQWSSGNLLLQCINTQIATAGDKVYIAGGRIGPYTDPVSVNYVNVYNSTTNTWNKLPKLSQARSVGAAASVGTKVIFAGGIVVLSYSKRVDMFDVNTGVRTTSNLSQARHSISVATSETKVVFAGGEYGTIGSPVSSNKVDIYDDATGLWSTALLSVKRQYMGAAAVGNKILFAGGLRNTAIGGYTSNRVDIYDVTSGTWSIASLSQAKYSMAVAVSGSKAYFAGGVMTNGTLSNRVDIYDALTNTWSYVTLSSPHMGMAVGITPGRILFAGGTTFWGNTGTKRVDALNLNTNTWYVDSLSQPRLGIGSASYGNQCVFMGGNVVSSWYPIYTIPSKRIDLWTDIFPRTEFNTDVVINSFLIYPNPANANSINIHFANPLFNTSEMFIYDLGGNLVLTKTLEQNSDRVEGIDISDLSNGEYLIIIETENNGPITGRFLIQK